MKKIIFIFAVVLQMSYIVNAQDIKLIKATSQSWAGGVCCRYGTNYSFTIQSKLNTIQPDTVWIKGSFYPIVFSDMARNGNTKKYDSLTHVYIYNFIVQEVHDDISRPILNSEQQKDSVAISHVPKKQFTGAALISFQYKGKQCTYVIKEFTQLKNLIYP